MIIGFFLLKWSCVINLVGKGIGFGCVFYIMGVMRVMKNNEYEGVIGLVIMILIVILICLFGLLFVMMFM